MVPFLYITDFNIKFSGDTGKGVTIADGISQGAHNRIFTLPFADVIDPEEYARWSADADAVSYGEAV